MCLLVQITGLGRLSFEEVIPLLAFIILNVWKYYFQFDWLIKLYTISSLLFYSRWYYYYSTVIKPPEFMPAWIFRQWTLWDWLKRQVPSVLHNLHVLAFTKVIAWVDLVNTVYNSFIPRSLLCLQATSDQSIILMSTFPSRQSLLKVCLPCEFSI